MTATYPHTITVTTTHPTLGERVRSLTVRQDGIDGERGLYVVGKGLGCSRTYRTTDDRRAVRVFLQDHAETVVRYHDAPPVVEG